MSGSRPQLRMTLGCTMPEPRISSQSLPVPMRISLRARSHCTATSSEGAECQRVAGVVEAGLVAGAVSLHVDRQRGLGEGEEARAEAGGDVVDLGEGLEELRDRPAQRADMARLVADQALDLVEHRGVGL